MPATLYALPASHPCAAIEVALRLKGVPYRRVDMIPVVSRLQQWRRFGGLTVPGVVFEDGDSPLDAEPRKRQELRRDQAEVLPIPAELGERALHRPVRERAVGKRALRVLDRVELEHGVALDDRVAPDEVVAARSRRVVVRARSLDQRPGQPEPEPVVEEAEEEIIATPTFDDEPWTEAPRRLP